MSDLTNERLNELIDRVVARLREAYDQELRKGKAHARGFEQMYAMAFDIHDCPAVPQVGHDCSQADRKAAP